MIDYNKIASALDYYQGLGYQYIEVPWVVEPAFDYATKPNNKKAFEVRLDHIGLSEPIQVGNLIASGEQAFLQLAVKEGLKGRYVCATPCWRDDKPDALHQRQFFKVELFQVNDPHRPMMDMMLDAADFFHRYVRCHFEIKGEDAYDVVTRGKGIELGSYGVRTQEISGQTISWVYGTGCAEPRLSTAINMERRK